MTLHFTKKDRLPTKGEKIRALKNGKWVVVGKVTRVVGRKAVVK